MNSIEKIITFVIIFQFVARLLRGLFKSEEYDTTLEKDEIPQSDELAVPEFLSDYDKELAMRHLTSLKQDIQQTYQNCLTLIFSEVHTPHYEKLNQIQGAYKAQLEDLISEIEHYTHQEYFERSELRFFNQESKSLYHGVDALSQSLNTLDQHQDLIAIAYPLLEDFFYPFHAFAHAEGLPISHQYMITSERSSDLLMRKEKLTLCPLNLNEIDDVTRWPILLRESAYCLDHLYPAWKEERHAKLMLDHHVAAPRVRRRTLQWKVKTSLGFWSDTLWADMFMIFRWGPNAGYLLLQYMQEQARHPKDLISVKVNADHDALLDPHVPAMIRMVVVCSLLNEMGYVQESKTLALNTQKALGTELHVHTSRSSFIKFAVESVRAEVEVWVNYLYHLQWNCWSQHCLSDIPFFEVSIADWRHIQSLTQQWIDHKTLSDRHFYFQTLFNLAFKYPGRAASLDSWLRPTSRVSSQAVLSNQNDHHTNDDLIAALVLSDLLPRRRSIGF